MSNTFPRVCITGATGYIGGDFLHLVSRKHPGWEITCLLRNSTHGELISQYPRVRIVSCDLDNSSLIEEEVSKSDIVFHFADNDHEPAAHAISKGFERRTRHGPGYWIHTSGTMNLAVESIETNQYGKSLGNIYDDWDKAQQLLSLPSQAPHRSVDKIVLSSTTKANVAIVCPPTIFGRGRGPGNTRSSQICDMVAEILKQRKAFYVGLGENMWHYIHIFDLSDLFLRLGEAAVSGKQTGWNEQGYYLAEGGSYRWKDMAGLLGAAAKERGYLDTAEPVSVTPEEIDDMIEHGRYLYGTDSRGICFRGKEILGWRPSMPGLEDELVSIVKAEADRLQLN
ncbi:unnamed protein product [Clonostachys rosea]|uniref:NAD-dependent epimerase/dehydratase domain-containing protein n=1 Tax=Bionectria ochroleuca TaxID=29856 RepID=A0ABY6U774_BIOOC|nr:unnamed protein product [Clonostachys rosea]